VPVGKPSEWSQVAGLCRTPFLVGPQAARTSELIMTDVSAAIEMTAAVGAPVLTVVTGGIEPGSRGIQHSLDLVAERLVEAANIAQQHNVKLALEPLHPVYGADRSCLLTVRDAICLCDAIGADNVGVAIDVYHIWWDTSLEAELLRAGADRIFGYHLCDWLSETRDVLLDRGMMGDGVADLKAIRRAVEGAGYQGFCEVEVFSEALWWQREPDEVLDVCIERFRSVC